MLWSALLGLLALGLGLIALVQREQLRRERKRTAALDARATEFEQRHGRTLQIGQHVLDAATHDIRTPLTAILGYQELLADGVYGEIGERCREPIVRIGRAAQQLMYLIDGVIELVRGEPPTASVDAVPIALPPVLARLRELLAVTAAERGARLELVEPGPLPLVSGDTDRLERALDLALTAALRSAAGEVVELRGAVDGDGPVRLEVTGISPALDVAEFGPDEEEVGDRVAGRKSLRLAIARHLLRSFGGELEVTAAGAGSTLRMSLPRLPSG